MFFQLRRCLLLIGLAFVALGALSACTLSLAGDVTPPPGYRPPTAAPPTPSPAPSYPVSQPDAASGQPIYLEKCAPCHGESGAGDGPQASQLPNPPAPIGSPVFARQSVPLEWYTMINEGNLERFMPPFSGSLSPGQIWDVVAYIYSLSVPVEEIELGRQVYQANCAGCHGEAGRGDGPDAADLASPIPDFTDPSWMTERTAANLFEAISNGAPPAMPAYADKLSEADRWALASYLRSLVLGAPVEALIASEPTPSTTEITQPLESEQARRIGTVTGQVINGSGGEAPSGLVVTLLGFDEMTAAYTATAEVDSGGAFTFEDVEMPPGRAFLVTADYSQETYGSDVAVVEEETAVLNFPVTVYDTTTDNSNLFVDRQHIFLDFVAPDVVQVTELYLVSNPTDRVVVSPAEGQPVLTFPLQEGATNLQFQDGVMGERYQWIDGGFGDTLAVRPGLAQHEVLFAYQMPYDGKLELQQTHRLPVNAVVLLIPEDGLKLRSDYLQDGGARDVQGQTFRVFTGESLASGSQFSLTLTGQPGGAALALTGDNSQTNLMLGLGVLGLAFIVVGVWLYRRNASPGVPSLDETAGDYPDRDSLIDAIIALDDLYKAGDLPEEAYLQRRAHLKSQLAEMIDD